MKYISINLENASMIDKQCQPPEPFSLFSRMTCIDLSVLMCNEIHISQFGECNVHRSLSFSGQWMKLHLSPLLCVRLGAAAKLVTNKRGLVSVFQTCVKSNCDLVLIIWSLNISFILMNFDFSECYHCFVSAFYDLLLSSLRAADHTRPNQTTKPSRSTNRCPVRGTTATTNGSTARNAFSACKLKPATDWRGC